MLEISSSSKRFLLIVFFILAITFASYFSCLDNDFTNWDENSYLLRNLQVRTLDIKGIGQIFSSAVFKTYSPLTVLSFAIEYNFFQYNPFIYHLDNLLLHLGVVFFVFLFALQCRLPTLVAILSALLFGLHPIHVESVAWIVERKDVLYAFFYMCSLCAYMGYLDSGKRKFYWLAFVLGLFSMLAKAMALSLPLIFLACDWLMERKFRKDSIIDKIPFFLYIIPIGWITYSLNARIPGEAVTKGLLIWIWTFIFYLKKFFFPFTLIPLYQLPQPINLYNPEYALAVLLFVGIILLLIVFRNNRLFIFSFLYYFLSIFFCLRFDHKVDVSIVADRFMYLPCLGFCLLIGSLKGNLLIKRSFKQFRYKIMMPVIVVVFFLLGIKTYLQCDIWQNSFSLWQYVIQKNPQEARAYDNLGAAFLDRKDYENALKNFEKAVSLDPDNGETYNNLGLVYLGQGEINKAIDYFNLSIKTSPDFAIAYNNLGLALRDAQQEAKAQAAFEKAISLDPYLLETRLNLAGIYNAQKMSAHAERLYLENLEIDPTDPNTQVSLIKFYFELSNQEKALFWGRRLLRTNENTDILMQLAGVFISNNDMRMAASSLKKVIRLNPKNKEAYCELGKIYGNIENFKVAVAIWQQGLKYYPDDSELNDLIKQAEKLMTGSETNE